MVKYDYFKGDNHWNRNSLVKGLKTRNDYTVQGVALFQMIKDRKLKAEFFPGKQASRVNAFTKAAAICER